MQRTFCESKQSLPVKLRREFNHGFTIHASGW